MVDKKVTMEERIKVHEYYKAIREKRRKKFMADLSVISKNLKLLFWIAMKTFLVGILGMGAIPIVYSLNSPLGMGYATWAGCAISGILWFLIPNVWEKK